VAISGVFFPVSGAFAGRLGVVFTNAFMLLFVFQSQMTHLICAPSLVTEGVMSTSFPYG
jgi:hypothetical protein